MCGHVVVEGRVGDQVIRCGGTAGIVGTCTVRQQHVHFRATAQVYQRNSINIYVRLCGQQPPAKAACAIWVQVCIAAFLRIGQDTLATVGRNGFAARAIAQLEVADLDVALSSTRVVDAFHQHPPGSVSD